MEVASTTTSASVCSHEPQIHVARKVSYITDLKLESVKVPEMSSNAEFSQAGSLFAKLPTELYIEIFIQAATSPRSIHVANWNYTNRDLYLERTPEEDSVATLHLVCKQFHAILAHYGIFTKNDVFFRHNTFGNMCHRRYCEESTVPRPLAPDQFRGIRRLELYCTARKPKTLTQYYLPMATHLTPNVRHVRITMEFTGRVSSPSQYSTLLAKQMRRIMACYTKMRRVAAEEDCPAKALRPFRRLGRESFEVLPLFRDARAGEGRAGERLRARLTGPWAAFLRGFFLPHEAEDEKPAQYFLDWLDRLAAAEEEADVV